MRGKNKFFIASFLLFVFGILSLSFIGASPAAPINLDFENNADVNYDEGHFNVVWESGGGDPETGYNVYIFSDDVFLMLAPNTSTTGYQVNGPAEAKYTFIIEALNGSSVPGSKVNSSDNVSITVDSTLPSLNILSVENNVFKKNTDTIYLNAFVSDADSGVVGIDCVVSVGGLNLTIPLSSGWCNSTIISLSGLSDGNKTIEIYAYDVAGNLFLNTDYIIKIDTTGPVISFECLPPNVNPDEEVTCNCTATDSGIGINESDIEFSENPSTSEVGTFERTCTATDLLGNENSETASYTVVSGTLYQGEDTNYSEEDDSWIYTYSINETEVLEGYTKNLALRRRIEFPLGEETHSVGVLEINSTHATLEIASTPIEKILGVGEETKIDLLGNGFYDVYILLNAILNNNTANLTVRNIHESVSGLVSGSGNETDLNSSGSETSAESKLKEKLTKKNIFLFHENCGAPTIRFQ